LNNNTWNYDSGLNKFYQFIFYSDNGYRTIFKSKVDLWHLKRALTTLTKQHQNRIDFEQILVFSLAHYNYGLEILTGKYQTSGSYTIRHQIINGQKVTNGEFNLQIF
jgi:hypothetical protein